MIPSERVEAVGQHLHEPGVAVDNRQPEPVVRALRGCLTPSLRVAPLGRHAGHSNARRTRTPARPGAITGSLRANSGDIAPSLVAWPFPGSFPLGYGVFTAR